MDFRIQKKSRKKVMLIGYAHVPGILHILLKNPNNLAMQELPSVH